MAMNRIRRPEKALQAQTRQALGYLGYDTFEAGKTRKRIRCTCPHCKHEFFQVPRGYQGNTPGYPDLAAFRWREGFPPVAIWIEEKGDDTAIEPEQQRLEHGGRSFICKTVEDAIHAVLEAERMMDEYRFAEGERERIERFLKDNEGRLY